MSAAPPDMVSAQDQAQKSDNKTKLQRRHKSTHVDANEVANTRAHASGMINLFAAKVRRGLDARFDASGERLRALVLNDTDALTVSLGVA